MADATILIPTHAHPGFLPLAIRSALEQRAAAVEVFVVGDGVGDDTRAAVGLFDADPRVRFFDFPKGERHGERHRHTALQEAGSPIVCYLSDDDVLLPSHVEEMRRLLAEVDFAHAMPVLVDPENVLIYRPADLARPAYLSLIREGRNNFISLTGAAHTRALYERLPHGWRPAPPGTPTDIHMWQQMTAVPGFSGATGSRLTAVHFPDPAWSGVADELRAATLAGWLETALRPGGEDELQARLEDAILRAAQDFKLRSIELSGDLRATRRDLEQLRTPPWRRLGRRLRHGATARWLRQRRR